MRTLFEIVDGAKDGQRPTYDECYWAMLALSALLAFERDTIHKMLKEEVGPFNREYYANQSLKRNQEAFKISPQQYVGWSNDPANPDYQRERRIFKKIADKVLGDGWDKDESGNDQT
jgi:hypothetical protein